MTRILLSSLTPATAYAIQLRSKANDGVSDWSRIFNVTTLQDTVAPQTPTGAAGSMNGTSFTLTWNAVTLSADGSPAYDLDTYIVRVTSSGSGNIGTFKIKGLRFDFSFEMNSALFGTPQANVQMAVAAADVVGNTSGFTSAISQTNAAPAAVTGLTAGAAADTILVNWTGIADTDLDRYEVHLGTSSGFATSGATLQWKGLGTSVTIRSSGYATSYWVKVIAYDVFNTPSTATQAGPVSPLSPFVIDTTAPAVPAGLSATLATTVDQKTTATVAWTAVSNPTNDLQGYMIRYKASADSDYDYTTVSSDVVSAKILVNKPYVNYDFAVRSFDFYANYSAWSSTVTATGASNGAPAGVTGLLLAAGVQSVIAQWTENTELDVINGAGAYEVQIDTANTFSTGSLKTGRTSGTILSFTGLASNTLYFVRVRAVDSLGSAGAYSSTSSTTTGVITNSDIIAGTISGDRVTAATLSGDRVIANTLDANTLKANSIIAQNLGVNSTLTMGDASNNGIIKSFGFATGVTGWQISKTGFEVNQGTIAAAALLIQDSDNIMPVAYADFEFVPSYYTSAIATVNVTSSSIQTLTSKFNAQFYRASWTTAASAPTVYLGTSNTDYNTNVEASSTYILSAWIRNTGAVTTVVRGNVKLSNGTTVQAFSVTPTISSSTWVRFSGTVAIPAGITTGLPFFDSSTLTTGAGFDLDGIQLERKITGATTPSPWTPPGLTRIDGGIVRTGTILSNATVTVNGTPQPSWSINLTGAAQFGDVSVRGKILVGQAGDPDLGQSYISSGNFVTGTTGWKIDSSGAAEFSNATVRGNVIGSTFVGGSITIPDSSTMGVTTPGYTQLNANGIFEYVDGTTNLIFDPSFELDATYTAMTVSATATTFKTKGPRYDSGGGLGQRIDQSVKWGKWALELRDPTSGNGFVDVNLGTGTALTLIPGQTYTLSVFSSFGYNSNLSNSTAPLDSAYVNTDNFQLYEKTTGAVVTIRSQGITKYEVLEAANGLTLAPGVYTSPGTGFQLVAAARWTVRWIKTFTLDPAAAASSTYYLRLPTSSSNNVGTGSATSSHGMYYDGVQLEAKPYVTKYYDGDQSRAYSGWNGTINNSSSTRIAGVPLLRIPNYGEAEFSGNVRALGIDTSRIKVGTGAAHGSNFFMVKKVAVGGLDTFTTSVWGDLTWDNLSTATSYSFDDYNFSTVSPFTSNKYFTAPIPGIYALTTTCTWTTNATGIRAMRHQIGLTGPGSEGSNVINETSISTPGTISVMTLTTIYWLDAGQSVNAQAWQNSGVTLTTLKTTATIPDFATFVYLGGI